MEKCPRCGADNDLLQKLDPETQQLLAKRSGEDVAEQICMNCYRTLSSGEIASPNNISPVRRIGSALVQAEKAKEHKKMMLWKSRVNLIKRARLLMSQRQFNDAAVAYEKYLKVMEVVFDTKPGELNPEAFKDSARTQELTVVASVYWDLLRIYDTNDKYHDRQSLAARKLSQFLKFTPLYGDIVKRAEAFVRTAKNPAAIRAFLKSASETKVRCFIATAAFDSADAPEVLALRQFRDDVLAQNIWGLGFISFYESASPPLARWIDRHPGIKPAIQSILRALLHKIRRNREF